MKTTQFAILAIIAFAGCFSGAWIALRPMPVQAQQVRADEYLNIPNGGLRMQNSRGRILGVISEQNGSGALTLFADDGTPSIQISAGSGGKVALGVNSGVGGLVIDGASGESIRVLAQNGKSSVSVGSGKTNVQITGGSENSILIPGADGAAQIDLRSTSDGGALKINGGGKTLVEVISSAGRGRVNVNGSDAGAVKIDGSGLFEILQQGRSVFAAPPKTADAKPGDPKGEKLVL